MKQTKDELLNSSWESELSQLFFVHISHLEDFISQNVQMMCESLFGGFQFFCLIYIISFRNLFHNLIGRRTDKTRRSFVQYS